MSTVDRSVVAKRLHSELGWYAWANDIERGRNDLADLNDALRGVLAQKQDWLKRHTFKPNTEGEATRDRATLWCERATALLAYLAGEEKPTTESQPPQGGDQR